MPARKRAIKSDLKRVERHRISASEYDDAPEITNEMLGRAEIVKGGKVVQRGRPPVGDQPKTAITLRLDKTVLAAYRATGRGWQSRINADLAKTAKKLKAS
jgi:uncharacterized protein (DUF4415 family)